MAQRECPASMLLMVTLAPRAAGPTRFTPSKPIPSIRAPALGATASARPSGAAATVSLTGAALTMTDVTRQTHAAVGVRGVGPPRSQAGSGSEK